MMSETNWVQLLDWNEEHLEDIRYVGYTYIKEGLYQTALSFFEALTVLNPGSVYDLQTLGAIYLQIGDNLAALNTLERAIKLDPDHLPTLLNRTKALFLLGYKPQAVAMAQKLATSENREIATEAEALIAAYLT
jgi:tetratricopeptide (TPR) repeat protein